VVRQWVGKSLKMPPAWEVDRDGSPFRGLRPFDARQSRVYFGRDRKVGRALDELVRAAKRERGRPFLLVVGPSGSGKSSLVRAGLVPRLTAAGTVPEVDLWRIAVMRPAGGATPFAAVAEALFFDPPTDQPKDDPGGFGSALPELVDGPYKSAAAILELLEAAPASASAAMVAALDAIGDAEKRK
jgi:eukaryotic-like serine/threonine-protein kinase